MHSRNFRTFDPAQARVILLDAGDTVLPSFPQPLQRRVHRDLRRLHLAFLTGFKNRVATVASWTVAFLGRGRPERTITEEQVFGRTRELDARPERICR